ncbi:hypothetical protein [Paractinoplanes durhamensis]|nr:hypothetical protein [Actinoplanes durhamensis]
MRHRSDGRLSWRLLATNNRDLGRAPATYVDAETCRDAVRWLQKNIDDLRVSIHRASPSSWSWRIAAGDDVVALSSRDYQRRIQAEQAASIVVELIPDAELAGMDQSRR